MPQEDIENRIRDTTHLVEGDPQPDPANCASPEPILCFCGKFSALTEGPGALLNKCEECFAALQAELGENRVAQGAGAEQPGNVNRDRATDAEDNVQQGDNLANDSGSITLQMAEGALALAMTDAAKSCTLSLNNRDETFTLQQDPINRPKGRHVFTRQSWELTFKAMYWYLAFGAMYNGKKVFVTPCVVRLKGYVDVRALLYVLLETMCNRPRYDGLCVNLETNDVFIVHDVATITTECLFDVSFDRVEIDRY